MSLKTIEEIIESNKLDAPKFIEEHVKANQKDFYYLEDRDTLKLSIEARSLLTNLNNVVENSPIKEALILTLMKLEAQFSSSKEHFNSTFTEISEYQSTGESDNVDTTKVNDNNSAIKHLRDIISRDHKIDTKMAEKLCRVIEGTEVHFDTGNYIGDKKTGRVDYVPPKHKDEYMLDWENFLDQNSNLDELILMAISHFQLEAIHPFPDGNGRTGRMINQAVIVRAGLSSDVFVPISKMIAENGSEYSELLSNITKNNEWKPYIMFMVESVRHAAHFAINMANEVEDLYRHISSVFSNSIKRDQDKIIFIMENPVCSATELGEEIEVTRRTAKVFLDKACQKGLMKKVEVDGLQTTYYNSLLIELIEKR